MNIEKMREEFEAEFRNSSRVDGDQAYADSMLERGHDGEYRSFWIAGAWWGYQASRESLVIELPQQSGANLSWNQAIRYCIQAIEAAGVKTK